MEMGLNGTIASMIFLSERPPSINIDPQKITRPFSGISSNSSSLFFVDEIAATADCLVCLSPMLIVLAFSSVKN
jgi:hypothetical protein